MARKSPETGAAASRPNITLHNVIFKNVQVPIVAPPGSKVEIQGSRFIPPRRPTGSEQKSSKKSGGWTPALDQAKQSLPVQCPECKTIFPSQIKFLPATELDVSGNTEPCPICNYPEARLADGIFRVGQDTIEVLSADETNRTMLEAFLRITSDVVAGKLSEQEAIKEADSISPRSAAAGILIGRSVSG